MTEAREILLGATALAVGYHGRPVVARIDLSVRAGEFWFVLGTNGTGKTTFLRTILGLLKPVTGAFRIAPSLGGREGIGFVPQRCDLNPTLPTTVREFVSLGLVGSRIAANEGERAFRDALAATGLDAMRERSYWSLSGGERQRALVARALVRRPQLLILDEPLIGLDFLAEARLMECLVQLNRTHGLALIFVSHDVELAQRFGSHAAIFGRDAVTILEQPGLTRAALVGALLGDSMAAYGQRPFAGDRTRDAGDPV